MFLYSIVWVIIFYFGQKLWKFIKINILETWLGLICAVRSSTVVFKWSFLHHHLLGSHGFYHRYAANLIFTRSLDYHGLFEKYGLFSLSSLRNILVIAFVFRNLLVYFLFTTSDIEVWASNRVLKSWFKVVYYQSSTFAKLFLVDSENAWRVILKIGGKTFEAFRTFWYVRGQMVFILWEFHFCYILIYNLIDNTSTPTNCLYIRSFILDFLLIRAILVYLISYLLSHMNCQKWPK